MSLDHLSAAMEIKQISEQRIITGFAAAGGLDRVGDVIDMAVAFRKTLAEKAPSDVAVFIGHDTSALPVGIPLSIEATPQGLLTSTKVFDGPAGDNLLAVARGLHAAGQSLGLSIGYRVTDSKPDRVNGKAVRRLTGIDLVEYSFAARQSIANPRALTTGVKATGGGMKVEQRGDKYHVVGPDGDSLGSYDTEAAAKAAMQMMADRGKTVADPNDLPDSAFLFIESGGQQDEGGKTVPRSKRHFAYRDAAGALDASALTTALAEIPQAKTIGLTDAALLRLQARVRLALEAAGQVGTKTVSPDAPEWQVGAPIGVRALCYRLLDISEQIATDHAAMRVLGEDTKTGQRMRPTLRAEIRELAQQLATIADTAEHVDQVQDGAADIANRRRRLQLMGV